MSFSIEEKLPGNYFQEVIDAQTEMVRIYLDDLDNLCYFHHTVELPWQPSNSTLVILMVPHPITLYFF